MGLIQFQWNTIIKLDKTTDGVGMELNWLALIRLYFPDIHGFDDLCPFQFTNSLILEEAALILAGRYLRSSSYNVTFNFILNFMRIISKSKASSVEAPSTALMISTVTIYTVSGKWVKLPEAGSCYGKHMLFDWNTSQMFSRFGAAVGDYLSMSCASGHRRLCRTSYCFWSSSWHASRRGKMGSSFGSGRGHLGSAVTRVSPSKLTSVAQVKRLM